MIRPGARRAAVGLIACGALLLCAVASCHGELDAGYNLPKGGDAGNGGSDAGLCVPESMIECYAGPAGTNGVGLCRPGTAICNADGMAYGSCDGAVLPRAEDCATPVDEDCDGLAPPCVGALLWRRGFGGASIDEPAKGIAVDASDNIYIAGWYSDVIDFGGGPLRSAGGQDVFVVKFDKAGTHLWSKRFGDAAPQYGASIASDAYGNIFIVGRFSGVLDFGGGGALDAGTAINTFVAKLDANGAHIWSKRFHDPVSPSPDSRRPHSISTDGAGNVVVTGNFTDSIDCGGSVLTSAGGVDLFVTKLDAAGSHLWSKRFGDAADQVAIFATIDTDGGIHLTGDFGGAVDFGGGALISGGGQDVFIAKLDAAGDHVVSQRFGDMADQRGLDIAVNAAGDALVTGQFSGILDFGTGPLATAGTSTVFLARVSPLGQPLWSTRFGYESSQAGSGVAVDPGGSVLLTGFFSSSIDFGGGPMASAGNSDAFLAKLTLSAEKQHLWSKRFGDTAYQYGRSVATDSMGNVIITGLFTGVIDLGDGPLTSSAGGQDIFLAKFSP